MDQEETMDQEDLTKEIITIKVKDKKIKLEDMITIVKNLKEDNMTEIMIDKKEEIEITEITIMTEMMEIMIEEMITEETITEEMINKELNNHHKKHNLFTLVT